MFTSTMFQRSARAVRFLAVAAMVAASAPAHAQGGHGGGGGGGGGGSGDGRGNAVLQCLGADCINVSKAQTYCTASYCPEIEKPERDNSSCEVRVCKLENGRRNCRIEVSYDERICIKHQFL